MTLIQATKEQWRTYCENCVKSSVYQDPRWIELIESVYPRIKINRLALKSDDDQILWLLPLVEIRPLGKLTSMLISLPFGNYGGFLLPATNQTGVTDNDLEPLVEFFEQNKAFALELRETDPPVHSLKIEDQFKRFEVCFPENTEELWNKTIKGNARTSVRKADKLGVSVVFDHDEAVKIFQTIYEQNASFHGTPMHSVSWYQELAGIFRHETQIVLARYEGHYIGALFILHYQGKSILHAAVTNPLYSKVPATDKLLWASFERIVENKISQCFDFGRTRADSGKHFFKKKWGGTDHPVYYSYLVKPGKSIPQILPENPKFGLAIQIWRRLPMFVKRLIGPFFRIRIPT